MPRIYILSLKCNVHLGVYDYIGYIINKIAQHVL